MTWFLQHSFKAFAKSSPAESSNSGVLGSAHYWITALWLCQHLSSYTF